jgi:hypothetical protein
MAQDLKYGRVTLEHTPDSMADDEPVFVLRAQDALAQGTIARYVNFVRGLEQQPSAEFMAGLIEVQDRFHVWQYDHKDQVKAPD